MRHRVNTFRTSGEAVGSLEEFVTQQQNRIAAISQEGLDVTVFGTPRSTQQASNKCEYWNVPTFPGLDTPAKLHDGAECASQQQHAAGLVINKVSPPLSFSPSPKARENCERFVPRDQNMAIETPGSQLLGITPGGTVQIQHQTSVARERVFTQLQQQPGMFVNVAHMNTPTGQAGSTTSAATGLNQRLLNTAIGLNQSLTVSQNQPPSSSQGMVVIVPTISKQPIVQQVSTESNIQNASSAKQPSIKPYLAPCQEVSAKPAQHSPAPVRGTQSVVKPGMFLIINDKNGKAQMCQVVNGNSSIVKSSGPCQSVNHSPSTPQIKSTVQAASTLNSASVSVAKTLIILPTTHANKQFENSSSRMIGQSVQLPSAESRVLASDSLIQRTDQRQPVNSYNDGTPAAKLSEAVSNKKETQKSMLPQQDSKAAGDYGEVQSKEFCKQKTEYLESQTETLLVGHHTRIDKNDSDRPTTGRNTPPIVLSAVNQNNQTPLKQNTLNKYKDWTPDLFDSEPVIQEDGKHFDATARQNDTDCENVSSVPTELQSSVKKPLFKGTSLADINKKPVNEATDQSFHKTVSNNVCSSRTAAVTENEVSHAVSGSEVISRSINRRQSLSRRRKSTCAADTAKIDETTLHSKLDNLVKMDEETLIKESRQSPGVGLRRSMEGEAALSKGTVVKRQRESSSEDRDIKEIDAAIVEKDQNNLVTRRSSRYRASYM